MLSLLQVIGVDMSSIVEHAKKIVADNNLSDTVEIIRGKVEEVTLPAGIEKVFFMVASQWCRAGPYSVCCGLWLLIRLGLQMEIFIFYLGFFDSFWVEPEPPLISAVASLKKCRFCNWLFQTVFRIHIHWILVRIQPKISIRILFRIRIQAISYHYLNFFKITS